MFPPSRQADLRNCASSLQCRDYLLIVKRNRHRVATLIIAEQCRMARAALSLSVRDLASLAKVSTNTLTRFERGEALYPRTIEAIRAALEAAGVEFIPENGGGAGVRLRKGNI